MALEISFINVNSPDKRVTSTLSSEVFLCPQSLSKSSAQNNPCAKHLYFGMAYSATFTCKVTFIDSRDWDLDIFGPRLVVIGTESGSRRIDPEGSEIDLKLILLSVT